MKFSPKTESQRGPAGKDPRPDSLQMKPLSVVIFKCCFGSDFVYLGIGSVLIALWR